MVSKKEAKKIQTYSTTICAQIPIILTAGPKNGYSYMSFFSLPGALTPIIPIHHEKMNRQVEKEKRKKEKKSMGPNVHDMMSRQLSCL